MEKKKEKKKWASQNQEQQSLIHTNIWSTSSEDQYLTFLNQNPNQLKWPNHKTHTKNQRSVPVVTRLVRTFNGYTDIVRLVLGELGESSTEFPQVKCSNLLVQVLRQNIYLLLILPT